MNSKFTRKKILPVALAAAPLLTVVSPAHAWQAPIPKRSVKSGSWIDLKASTDKMRYRVGEPIRVTLKATNIQGKDAYLNFSSGQRFDIRVFKDGASESVYTWSANKMFTQALGTVKLKMAQRETYNTEIGSEMGELPAGKYRLEAHLTNSSQIRALPIEFTIAPTIAQNDDKRATLTATTDKRVYKVGEEVKINFSLKNNPTIPTTFNFRSGQNYDVFIKNAAGMPIWNWSANIRFIMVSRPVTLAAGEQRNFSVKWDGDGSALPDRKVTPGIYTVQAVYASDPEVFAPPVTIEIR